MEANASSKRLLTQVYNRLIHYDTMITYERDHLYCHHSDQFDNRKGGGRTKIIDFSLTLHVTMIYKTKPRVTNQGELVGDTVLQASLLMHHTRFLEGVAMTELVLRSLNEVSRSEVLIVDELLRRASALFIRSISECLTRWLITGLTGTLAKLSAEKQGETAGELGLLRESSCSMSCILDRMLKATFLRAREYASSIEWPTS